MNTPLILDGKFFEIVNVSEDGNRVAAKCKSCTKDTVILGSLSATSNFLTHLKRAHKAECESYDEYKKFKSRSAEEIRARKRRESLVYPTNPRPGFSLEPTSTSPTQDMIDHLITKFVVNGSRPLATVEDPDFQRLVTGLCPGAQVMDKKELKYRIVMESELYRQKTSSDLHSALYICISADVWTADRKTFLGLGAHWINDSLERKSCLLTCRCFKDLRSQDQIIDLVLECFKKFQFIQSKLLCIVVDNAKDHASLFRPFIVQSRDFSISNGDGESTDDEEEVYVTESFRFESLNSLLRDASVERILPKYNPCLPHSLSSTIIAGSLNVDDATTKRVLLSAMGKCSALWYKCSREKFTDVVRDITGKIFPTAKSTKWTMNYDFVRWILDAEVKIKLEFLCNALKVSCFSSEEVLFLEEFKTVLKPIAHGLELLQGENTNGEVFLSSLLPCLLSIQSRLLVFSEEPTNWIYAKTLAIALLDNLHSTFSNVLNFHDAEAVFAAISHPYFKLRWIPQDKYVELRQWFLDEAQKRSTEDLLADHVQVENEESDNDFYSFPSEKHLKTEPGWTTNKARLECLQYFEDSSTKLEMLHKYPLVKGLFVQFNTPLTSSAPVEKLLDFTGAYERYKRNRLSEKCFEMFMLSKCNKE